MGFIPGDIFLEFDIKQTNLGDGNADFSIAWTMKVTSLASSVTENQIIFMKTYENPDYRVVGATLATDSSKLTYPQASK